MAWRGIRRESGGRVSGGEQESDLVKGGRSVSMSRGCTCALRAHSMGGYDRELGARSSSPNTLTLSHDCDPSTK